MKETKKQTPRLEVYLNRSVLVSSNGSEQEFMEGTPSAEAKKRLKAIRAAFDKGFLCQVVDECRRPDFAAVLLDKKPLALLTGLVDSVTSEVGRALVGLTVLQLAIKAICPDQSIRLHKGGAGGENFSWSDGIPMRVLDKEFNTPILRKYDLLHVNADGVFMTRSLAENYPYSKLYKAALRGARTEWLEIVDSIEDGALPALDGLKQLIAMLLNRSDRFKKMATDALAAVKPVAETIGSLDNAILFLKRFVDSATYSARLFEIVLHSLFQVLEDAHAVAGHLAPLSQMRSANKKHGNIGDIEVTRRRESLQIQESWDAKYGKPYLRDELEELNEKLDDHPEVELAGFVVDLEPSTKNELKERKSEIEQIHGVKIEILEFGQWAKIHAKRTHIRESVVARDWIIAFAESLCQLRRDRAPIDEPSDTWIAELLSYANSWK